MYWRWSGPAIWGMITVTGHQDTACSTLPSRWLQWPWRSLPRPQGVSSHLTPPSELTWRCGIPDRDMIVLCKCRWRPLKSQTRSGPKALPHLSPILYHSQHFLLSSWSKMPRCFSASTIIIMCPHFHLTYITKDLHCIKFDSQPTRIHSTWVNPNIQYMVSLYILVNPSGQTSKHYTFTADATQYCRTSISDTVTIHCCFLEFKWQQ